jgi:hypothetical protein
MIDRAVANGTAARWVAGDEVYGSDPGLRAAVAGHGLGFVLAVAKDHPITTAAPAPARTEPAATTPGTS